MTNLAAHTKAWLFLAVASAARTAPAGVDAVSRHADFVDHSVPTDGELADTLPYLVASGLITRRQSEYTLTEAGLELYRQAASGAGNLRDTLAELTAAFSGASRES